MSEIIQAAVILVGGSCVLYVTYCVMRADEYDRRVARIRARLASMRVAKLRVPHAGQQELHDCMVKFHRAWIANEVWEAQAWLTEAERVVERWDRSTPDERSAPRP
jgi:hypothetical protein